MKPVGSDVHEYQRDEAARQRIIVIAVPSFGTVSIRWHVCMLGLKAPMNRPVHQSVVIGAEVGVARNELVARALALEDPRSGLSASHIFFVDDDVLLSQSALQQLYAHKRPLVSGLYYSKSAVPYPLILTERLGGTAEDFTHGDVVECYAHGMGCTLIDLTVFERMHAAGVVESEDTPCSQCVGVGCRGCCQTGKALRWFHTTKEEALEDTPMGPKFFSQTEDVYFCERAAQIGVQPTVDTGVFGFHWDKVSGEAYPREQWREYRATGDITWGAACVPA